MFDKNNVPKKDRVITEDDMKFLKKIEIHDIDVTDELLAPLKYASNLEIFSVLLNSKNNKRQVTDFSVLSNAKNLTTFYYMNQDSEKMNKDDVNLATLVSNNLRDVRINKTNLVDIAPLSRLNLSTLSLQDNTISDISAIRDMINLERLDLDNNAIVNIDALKNVTNLKTLYLRDNPLEDIKVLESLKNIEALHLRGTKIDNINVLTKLPKLHRLYIDKIATLPTDYMTTIKTIDSLNTLFVGNISLEDYEWLKNYSTRPKVDASFDEDRVRMFNFDSLVLSLDKNMMTDNIKDWNDDYVIPEELYDNISFDEGKIKLLSENSVKYNIYIENYDATYGDYDQPAIISGNVELSSFQV